jgi:hypothetical protein
MVTRWFLLDGAALVRHERPRMPFPVVAMPASGGAFNDWLAIG